jgi:hypothetical protein
MAKSPKSPKATTAAKKVKRRSSSTVRHATTGRRAAQTRHGSSPRGTRVEKISASLDAALVAEAREALREGESLSAMLNQSLEQSLVARRGLAAVEEYELEHGALTDDELAEADRRLAAL